MVSIKDISAACGVSVATVSKALNDQKDVGEATKAKVKKMALKMGYVPNAASQSLKTGYSYNIGVLYMEDSETGLAHGFYSQVLDGIKRTAEQRGYDITFVNNNSYSGGRKLSYLDHCRYRNFDGVAVVCMDFDDPDVLEIINSDIPSIILDYSGPDCNCVISSNYEGTRELVKEAYSRGHRRIAYIHGTDSVVTKERMRGFKDAMEELGLDIPDEYILTSPYRDTMSAHLKTNSLLQLKEPPTCILYPDDFATIGGINAISKAGLSIPEDISVIGFDGLEMARYIEPSLTTYVQDSDMLGSQMAQKLIDRIESSKEKDYDRIVVSAHVYHGNSLGIIPE